MTAAGRSPEAPDAPLKVVIFDVSDTVLGKDGTPAPGIADAIDVLRHAGIKVAMAANAGAGVTRSQLNRVGIGYDLVVGLDTAGGHRKPSPVYCRLPAEHFGAEPHEMVYVGDNDKTDALCAVNAGVMYLAARWANPAPKYGQPVDDPNALLRFVFRFMMARPRWHWTKEMNDRLGHPVHVRALLRAARSSQELKAVLKFNSENFRVEGLNYRNFLFRRLLTALYLDGLLKDVDTWAWYPSHHGQPKHRSFLDYLDQVTRLFRQMHVPDLLVRHTTAQKLATARYEKRLVFFASQVGTVHLNPDRRSRVEGKHVLVVDDFCTAGYSFEWARNLLYAGGAARVTCVAFGRYHDEYNIYTPKKGVSFDPWAPVLLNEQDRDFDRQIVRGVIDPEAENEEMRLLRLAPVGTVTRPAARAVVPGRPARTIG